MEDVFHYLNMQVDIILDKSKITFHETTSFKKILKRFHMQNCKPISTLINPGISNLFLPFKKQANEKTIEWY